MKRTPLHAKVTERSACVTTPNERRLVYSFKTTFEAEYFLRRLRDDQNSSHWTYAARLDDRRVGILKPATSSTYEVIASERRNKHARA